MIYGVSFSENLADTLAKDLLSKFGNDPFQLANIHVILPTKRACLTLKNAFMHSNTSKGILLPHFTSLYELDILDENIPPALSSLQRILLLANLCRAKPNILGYNQALKMAISLAELLDLSYQFDIDLSKINSLVKTEQFATHWQETVKFLDILSIHWPKILEEQQKIDPMDRTIRLIRSMTKKIQNDSSGLVVLAGFTNLFPALKELIEVVSQNPKNLILKENYIGNDSNIPYYTNLHFPQENAIIEALTKDNWEGNQISKNSFQNVRLLNASTLSEEALTIALILREVLEKPNQTGSLVTTDRTLARQVISQMQRWGIQLNDSAGVPLNHTDIGIFFKLIADLGLKPSASQYLALLKHPLAADGYLPSEFRHLIQNQEYYLRKKNSKWQMDLHTDFTKWLQIFKNNILLPLKEILILHIKMAESLAKSADRTASERLWQTEAGKCLFDFLTELLKESDKLAPLEPAEYPEILSLLMQQISVRPKYGMHPRLNILGPIEARFHHSDVCVIGGLNEGTYPSLPETGPWLNRPMRKEIGFPAPEEKIHEAAMDFAHNFCSQKVYLTRSLKIDGAQAIPSRFLERLKAVAEINQLTFPEYQAKLPTLLDKPDAFDVSKRPQPRPPAKVRPNHLPVTQIEMWRRNPYAIYARYILKLFPLYPLEQQNKNAEFGSLIHEVIKKFFSEKSQSLTKDKLLQTAHKIFENSSLSDIDKTLLDIKFDAMADFIIEQEQQDAPLIKTSMYEKELHHTFDIQGQPFQLSGSADRIDILKNNSARIVDYKTYSPPKEKEVKAGYAPQLTLEALLLYEEQNIPVSTLTYWYLSNKKQNSESLTIVESVSEVLDLIQKAKDGLYQMVSEFRKETTPYEVCPIPSQAPQFNDYNHLARMQEWAFAEENDS